MVGDGGAEGGSAAPPAQKRLTSLKGDRDAHEAEGRGKRGGCGGGGSPPRPEPKNLKPKNLKPLILLINQFLIGNS